MNHDRRKKYRGAGHNRWSAHRPEWWNRLHELWTKAANQPDYVPQQWNDFAECLERLENENKRIIKAS